MPDGRVFLTTDTVGGVWRYSLELARQYARRDLGVDLVVLGPVSRPERLAEAAEIPGVEVVVTDLPLSWMAEDPHSLRLAADELSTLASRRGARLVHLNCAGLGCARHWDTPLVVTLHSCMASWWRAVKGREPLPYDFSWRTEMLRDALCEARRVIAPSGSFAAAARELYREIEPPAVVYNGRETAVSAHPAAERSTAVFTCGRLWDEAKNVQVLDAASDKLGAPIQAAGATRSPRGGEIVLSHLDLLGELSGQEVEARLDHSGIYTSAALYEPFGLGVLEAAKRGCALVLSDIPTFRELWGGAAELVEPRDPEGFATAITRLRRSREERTAAGRRAQQRAADFTAARMAAGTLAVYAQATRQPHQARAAS